MFDVFRCFTSDKKKKKLCLVSQTLALASPGKFISSAASSVSLLSSFIVLFVPYHPVPRAPIVLTTHIFFFLLKFCFFRFAYPWIKSSVYFYERNSLGKQKKNQIFRRPNINIFWYHYNIIPHCPDKQRRKLKFYLDKIYFEKKKKKEYTPGRRFSLGIQKSFARRSDK